MVYPRVRSEGGGAIPNAARMLTRADLAEQSYDWILLRGQQILCWPHFRCSTIHPPSSCLLSLYHNSYRCNVVSPIYIYLFPFLANNRSDIPEAPCHD
jgi:hypothetical protein